MGAIVKRKLLGALGGRVLPRLFLAAALVGGVAAFFGDGAGAAGKTTNRYVKISGVLVDRGLAALDKSQLDGAKTLFEEAIVANPQNAEAYSYLGSVYARQNNNETASKYFTTALEIDPNLVKALGWGGKADLDASHLDSAEAKLMRLQRICGPSCAEYKMLSDAVTTYKSTKKAN